HEADHADIGCGCANANEHAGDERPDRGHHDGLGVVRGGKAAEQNRNRAPHCGSEHALGALCVRIAAIRIRNVERADRHAEAGPRHVESKTERNGKNDAGSIAESEPGCELRTVEESERAPESAPTVCLSVGKLDSGEVSGSWISVHARGSADVRLTLAQGK